MAQTDKLKAQTGVARTSVDCDPSADPRLQVNLFFTVPHGGDLGPST